MAFFEVASCGRINRMADQVGGMCKKLGTGLGQKPPSAQKKVYP